MLRRRSLAVLAAFFLCLPLCGAPRALDEIQGVSALWNDFVSALRRGDYLNAHGLFSPQSRAAMPYPEFVSEYGPLSAAREMILAKPDSLSTKVDGDWGEITYGGTNPGTGRKFSVGVSFARNSGGWGLVAARNETAERLEASARALLRLLSENRGHGAPRDLVSALTNAQTGNPALRAYRLETDGARFVAFPLESGLRVFFTDELGGVQSVDQMPQRGSPSQPRHELLTTPSSSSLPPKATEPPRAAPAPRDPDALPELSDPASASPQLSDWPEPPMPSGASSSAAPLPDTIR